MLFVEERHLDESIVSRKLQRLRILLEEITKTVPAFALMHFTNPNAGHIMSDPVLCRNLWISSKRAQDAINLFMKEAANAKKAMSEPSVEVLKDFDQLEQTYKGLPSFSPPDKADMSLSELFDSQAAAEILKIVQEPLLEAKRILAFLGQFIGV